MKHKILYLLLVVLCIGSLVWGFYPRLSVVASDDIVSISITHEWKPSDTYQQPANRLFFISEFSGTGSFPNDPFLPSFLSTFPKHTNWGMIDLRPDATKVDGYCIVYVDTDTPISKAGVLQLTSTPFEKLDLSETSLLNTRYKTSVPADATLTDFIKELLSVKQKDGPEPLQPMIDGKVRIYLGGQIYGDPELGYSHSTITDAFTRADADALGTSSEGWSWVERAGDADIVSNRARSMTVGGMSENYANTGDPTTDDHYSQAKVWKPGANTMDGGVAVRMSTSAETYYGFYTAEEDSVWSLFKFVAGSYTPIATYGTGWALPSGNTLYLSADGSALVGKQDGSTKISTTDTSITGNTHAGLSSYKPADYDDFEASDLASIAITVSPTSYDFGTVAMSSTSNTTTTYFTIDNTSGVQTDQTISVTANTWSGGVGWTHSDTATPGADQVGLVAQRGGVWGASPVIVKYSSPNYIYENCPATTDYSFGLSLVAPTSVTDGVQKAITVRVSAAAG